MAEVVGAVVVDCGALDGGVVCPLLAGGWPIVVGGTALSATHIGDDVSSGNVS